MRFPLIAFAVLLELAAPCVAQKLVTFSTDSADFAIESRGSLSAISSKVSSRNYLATGQPAPLVSLRFDGKLHAPDRANWDAATRRLTLQFSEANATAVIVATAKPTHLVLELVEVQPAERVELALWGPYPTRIGETIGEIVGVVRDREIAVGIQALNAKTLGGYPSQENDMDLEFGADDSGYYPNLPSELSTGQGFRGDTARATPFGSVLQAYCRNRHQERILPNWGHEKYRVAPFRDGGVVGSRIALFAVPEPQALAAIGAIELAEGLPHPLIDGVWAKVSPGATASYLIVDFGESTVDRAIEMTRRAGLKYLYHSSPFATWGHFQLKPALFPNGWKGFRACVEKARRAGVLLGFHTLSNFINPEDSYVTPVPDARLAVIGESELAVAVTETSAELTVNNPEYFTRKSALNTVRIGNELIRFGAMSEQTPWRLLNCERGAWGTRPSAHSTGVWVRRLLDHDYKVFLADADLSQEIARNIADFCNQTGARQLSFDGLEGNWSTGYGQYGRTLFTQAWYEALDAAGRGQVINDASNPGHFNWHINTRMNWGEPWYAGFRESQTLYRFKNQVLFERNFMPHMLGWFALRADTSIEDAEWLLARAAGFDAGFTLATSLASTAQLAADPASADTARQFGATSAILARIAQWETARLAGAFPPEVKALLRDNTREFQLRLQEEGRWDLQEAFVSRFNHGEGTAAAEFELRNPAQPQPLQWIVRSTAKTPVSGVTLELNGRRIFDLGDVVLPAGGSLKYSGGAEVVIADASWKELTRVPSLAASAPIETGAARLKIGATLPENSSLKIELRTFGPSIRLATPPR